MAAVILSTVVVLFATNVTSNQVQKENLYISGTFLTTTTANIDILNTGATSIMINRIVIKGERFTNFTSTPAIESGLTKGNSTMLNVTLTNDLVTTNDIGRPVTVLIYTNQGAYFTETLVEAGASSSTSTPTPSSTPEPTSTPTPTPTPTP